MANGHRWFAALYDRLTAPAERSWMREVRRYVHGGARGRVLEIGMGTGHSLPYYEAVEELAAVEPNPFMLERARRKAEEQGVAVALHQAPAEELPFESDRFDTVVSTLVLCSVRDPLRALAEVRRVLRPGGQFRFYEHVRATNPVAALGQDLATPLWRWFAAGCHPNRDTTSAVEQAGFSLREVRRSWPVPPIPPMLVIRPHVMGVAEPLPEVS